MVYSDSSSHSESRQPYNHSLHSGPEYTSSTWEEREHFSFETVYWMGFLTEK